MQLCQAYLSEEFIFDQEKNMYRLPSKSF